MNGREYLKKLMEDHQDNPNSLSAKTRVPQPTIFRFLSGEAKEPRRSTLEPIARHYGVDIDSFFSGSARDQSCTPSATDPNAGSWPFTSVTRYQFDALPLRVRKDIEDYIEMKVSKEPQEKASHAVKSRANG